MNERLLSAAGSLRPDMRLSRRKFAAALPLAGLLVAMEPGGRNVYDEARCQVDIHWPREKAYSNYDAYVAGYPHASPETYSSVFSSLTIQPVSSPVHIARVSASDRLARVETNLDSDQFLLLDVSGVNDPDWSLRAVEVKTEERSYYDPIIETEQSKTGRMVLGQKQAGRIAFDIMATRFSHGITANNIGIQLFRVDGNSKCMALMRLLNNLYLRDDNDAEDHFLSNDFPILAEAYLRQNPFTRGLMWEEWQKLTSQDGGTPLCRALNDNGTTNDNEVLGIDRLTEEALLIERVDQGEDHALVPFQKFDPPVVVRGDIIVDKQLHKKNNMTKRDITSSHAVALFPYLPAGGITASHAHLMLAAEVFGARERWRQGGVDTEFVRRLARQVGRDIVSESYAYKDVL